MTPPPPTTDESQGVMTIWFVRHAEKAPSGAGDPGISPNGRVEAIATARELAARPIARVFSSPLLRAAETAALNAEPHALGVEPTELLRERANWGDLPGQTLAEFQSMWASCSRDRDLAPPVGDSSRAAGRRLEDFVRRVSSRGSAGQHIVAVTHGGVLADFLRNVFSERELAAANAGFSVAPYDGAVMRECSITSIRTSRDGVALSSLALTGHLAGRQGWLADARG